MTLAEERHTYIIHYKSRGLKLKEIAAYLGTGIPTVAVHYYGRCKCELKESKEEELEASKTK